MEKRTHHREEFIKNIAVESERKASGEIQTKTTLTFATGRQFVQTYLGGLEHPLEHFEKGERVWATLQDNKVVAVSAF